MSPDASASPIASNNRLLTKRAAAAIRVVLVVLVLAFVGRALYRDFSKIDWSSVHFQILPLLGAFVTLICVPLTLVFSYRALLGSYCDPAPSLKELAAAVWYPMLAKYLPGKVASIALPALLMRKSGVPAATGVSLILALDGVMVLTGLIIGSPLLLWPPIREQFSAGPTLVVGVIVCGLIALHPRVFFRITNFGLRKLRRPTIDTIPPLRAYVVPILIATFHWLLVGATLWLLAESLGQSSLDRLPMFIAIGALAYTISYLVVITPGGIGPREFVLIAGLGVVMNPAELASVVTVSLRIVQVAMEVIISLTGYLVWKSLQKSPTRLE